MKLHLILLELISRKKDKEESNDAIDIDKGAPDISESVDSNSGYLVRLQRETKELCTLLNVDYNSFSEVDFFEKMYLYVEQDKRLVYSSITNYIFTLGENKIETDELVAGIINNLQRVIDFTDEPEFSVIKNNKDSVLIRKTEKYILKLWDHINLAQRQYERITEEEEYYQKLASESVEEATKPISNDLNKQLISLVAIFTALSFVVFGGISSLSGIFANANELPVLKVIVFGSLWAICMINLVFMFMFFISNLIGKSIATSNNINDNYIKRYPLIFFCNWVFCTVFILSLGAYYWEENRLLYSVTKLWGHVIPVISLVYWGIVIIDVVIGIILLYKLLQA